MADIDNINHVGMAVRDLRQRRALRGHGLPADALFRRIPAAWTPGEPVQPLGSGNRCVMFENTYLEILASADPLQAAAAHRQLPQAPSRRAYHLLQLGSPRVP